MQRHVVVLATALAMAPLGAKAADLVVVVGRGLLRRGGRCDPRGIAGGAGGAGERQAATTRICAAGRERGFLRMTISTSRSSAVRKVISRSTENPASL